MPRCDVLRGGFGHSPGSQSASGTPLTAPKNQKETSNPPLPFNVLPDPNGCHISWRLPELGPQSHHPVSQHRFHLPLVFDGMWMFQYDATCINARHGNNQFTNILFADGHCENATNLVVAELGLVSAIGIGSVG